MRPYSSSALRAAVIWAASSGSFAHAIDFEYIKIIESGDPLPGGTGTYSDIIDFDFEDSQIVFNAEVPALAGRSVFKSIGGQVTTVATKSTSIPGGTGTFSDFFNVSISQGEIAFRGMDASDATGIYATRHGNLTRIADATTPIPGATDLYLGAKQASAGQMRTGVNSGISAGNVVFGAAGASPSIFLAQPNGSLRLLSGPSLSVTGSGPGTIDGDHVAFIGSQAGGRGIFRYSISAEALTPVVPPGTVFPNGAQPALREVPAISGNAVAFNVETGIDVLSGIYVADDSGIRLVADATTPVPGSTGTFLMGSNRTGFHGVTISQGNVAFLGARAVGGTGIYTTLGGGLSEVISTDDTLFGRAVNGFGALAAPPKIDGGNVLFSAKFTDGTTGLYVAASEHHWTGAAGSAWDSAANWNFGLAPRQVIPTFIDPANGGIITGPATPTALNALSVGASQAGVAELRMQANGQIHVAGVVTITARGRLETTGVLSAAGGVDNSGILAVSGTGQIAGQLSNRASGEVRVGAGQRLTIAGGASTNAGVVGVTGGELEFTGTLSNLPSTGVITARDATLRFGQLTNAGSLAIVAGTTDVHGDIVNTGSIAVSGGAAGGTQTAIFHDDVVQNGTLTVTTSGSTPSVAVFLGGFTGAGGITGGGDVFFEGDLRPGNSPASVTYSANIALTANTRLTMEIGGRAPGTQHDHLAINGDLTLGGTLAIVLVNGFTPASGDTFDLFDFDPARLSGNLASIELPALASGLSWDTSQITNSGALAVIPEPTSATLLLFGATVLLKRRRAFAPK